MADEGERAEPPARLPAEHARVLYGPAAEAADRERVLAEVERAAREHAAAERAGAATGRGSSPDIESAPRPESREELDEGAASSSRAVWHKPRAAQVTSAIALVAVLALAGGYALGSSRSVPRPAASATSSPLPTVLYFDDRDGEVIHLAVAHPGDTRSSTVTLPEMVRGWSLATACLSRDSTPRTVPKTTAVLLDGAGRQLGSWTVPCDTAERRYFAIPAPARPTRVQLLLVLDDRDVSAAWATIDPNR
jgi:hypothetical protein